MVSNHLKCLIIWPDRVTIQQNLPESFKKKYEDAVCIIDCSEIYIERLSNLTGKAQTWSSYKHTDAVKYLIRISSGGAIMFSSSGWGGKASDKHITMESGFIDYVLPGNVVLADQGFNLKEELAFKGAVLKILSFTKGKKQLSGNEVDYSRQLSKCKDTCGTSYWQNKKI